MYIKKEDNKEDIEIKTIINLRSVSKSYFNNCKKPHLDNLFKATP